ncbi:restriction endonuclease subunit S [Gemmiger formicilis]|uniref:restriction endonuclease subunit S n=3 Tax=Eubacteriales TaxID=186802 RepID=UPI00307CD28C
MAKYKLGEICEIVSGSTPKTGIAEYWDGNLKWITPAEIDDESYIITDSARKLTKLGVKKTGLSSFPSGTVILSSRAPIGKVAIAGCEMYCNQGFKNLICSDRINNRYLYWFLKGNTAYLNSLGRGATFKEISKKIVSDIEINVPEISQQLAAVDALERVSEIIRLRKNQLQKLDELIKARFVELFGDPLTNPKGYQEKYLSEIAEYWNGLTYKPDDVANEGTIVLRSSNIQNASLDFADTVRVNCKIGTKKYVQDNDILMCSRNGSAKLVGKVALIKELSEPMSFGAFMMIIRSAYYPFLMTYFQLPAFRSQITTGATTTINQITGRMLDNVKLAIPDIESAKDFSAFTNQVDKSKAVEGLYSSLCL